MNISENIRKFRKEQNLTQEQVANQLGVSAPAVNKWESGNSYPDITLLAPLARVLRTDVDTLLSFNNELTDIEISQFITMISEDVMSKGFEVTFQEAVDKIREYPNCDKLILLSAQILNGYLVIKMGDIKDKDKYQTQITKWMTKVAFGDNAELSKEAMLSLAQNLMKDEKYEAAQEFLDKIPPLGFDKRITQTQLFIQQEKFDDAYKLLEEMTYQQANGLIASMTNIISALIKQKNYDTAFMYISKISSVASLFDLGTYVENSFYFMIYSEMGDADKALNALEKMMDSFDTMGMAKYSKLYQHMKFSSQDGLAKMKELIVKSFDNAPEIDFIRSDPRFKQILSKYTK